MDQEHVEGTELVNWQPIQKRKIILNKEQIILLSIFAILFSGFMIFWPEFRSVLIDWFYTLLDMVTNLLGWVCVLGGIGLFVYGKWKKSVKKQGFGILAFLIGLWLIGIL